jgi:hypothetical protein
MRRGFGIHHLHMGGFPFASARANFEMLLMAVRTSGVSVGPLDSEGFCS